MPMKLRLGGAWKDITGAKVFSGGAWRSLQAIKVFADGAWRDVASFVGNLSLALSTSSISRNTRVATINTASVTATPTGGATPFTYAWVKQSGDTITANQPTSASCSFQAAGMAEEETRTAVFRCTATDSFANTASADVTVTIHRLAAIDTGGNV